MRPREEIMKLADEDNTPNGASLKGAIKLEAASTDAGEVQEPDSI